MKTSNLVIGFIVLVVLVGGAYYYNTTQSTEPAENPEGVSQTVPVPGSDNVDEMIVKEDGDVMEKKDTMIDKETASIITYTDAGFSPSPITISKGSSVMFKNESSRDFWPASALHPTHTAYPGSDIKKCDTIEGGNIFDACKRIPPGGEYSFTFSEAGEWGYHDHLRANLFGKVVVQ